MALDYNQKKQVIKNRPRKRPLKLVLVLILGGLFSIYGLGIATGWLIFKYLPHDAPSPSSILAEKDPVAPSPASPTQKSDTAEASKEPDLTFYYTLPKGEKAVMGSGINRLPAATAPQHATPVQEVRPPQQQKPATEIKETAKPVSPKEKTETLPEPAQPVKATKDEGKTTYTVQIAAYHEKSDALELKGSLQKSGISARIEEFSVTGKGIWYRVRTGRKLDKETANKVAAKIGNNAILVTD